jgi:hypothetical protein
MGSSASVVKQTEASQCDANSGADFTDYGYAASSSSSLDAFAASVNVNREHFRSAPCEECQTCTIEMCRHEKSQFL